MTGTKDWIFGADGWQQIKVDWPAVPERKKWDDSLKACGYELFDYFGGAPDLELVKIYRAEMATGAERPAEFLVYLGDGWGSWLEPIFVADFPRLFELLPKLQGYALRRAALQYVDELHDTVRRAFRAWHGHYPEDACLKCDPSEVRHRKREEA